jgi:hypothetical protein
MVLCTKSGMALLGGIQINTGPDTPDYYHPLRFDYMNSKGGVVEDLLSTHKLSLLVQVRSYKTWHVRCIHNNFFNSEHHRSTTIWTGP